MKSEGIYKKYTPGLGLTSTVAQFQIKSCNTMKRFCALFCSEWVTSEAFVEGARHDQILVPEKSSLLQHFAHIVSSYVDTEVDL